MRFSYLALVIILLVVLGVVGYGLYDWFKTREGLMKIEIYVEKMRVTITPSMDIGLGLDLTLVNKGSDSVSIDRILYEIYINNISVGVGNYSSRIDIAPGGVVSVTSQIILHRASLGEAVINSLLSGKYSTKLTVYLYKDTLLGSLKVIKEIVYSE